MSAHEQPEPAETVPSAADADDDGGGRLAFTRVVRKRVPLHTGLPLAGLGLAIVFGTATSVVWLMAVVMGKPFPPPIF